jgi:cAMP-dependent protein kinase regulator
MIWSGEAEAYVEGNEKPVLSYKLGDWFGELGILKNKQRAATIKANSIVSVLKIEADTLLRFKENLEEGFKEQEQLYK